MASPNIETLQPGEEIQGYRIDAVLGVGGFGVVYRGSHDVLGREAAIKEFFPHTIARRAEDGRTVQEISDAEWYRQTLRKFVDTTRALSKLDHPNIVRVHGFENRNGTAYMIMDLVHGRTLRSWREATDEPITEAMAQRVFTPVMDALGYMHRHNMLHRDVSPDNVMLDGGGRAIDSFAKPMLIDFGALKLETPTDGTRSVSAPVFHPVYSPPEQSDTTGAAVLTAASEVYSLAATLYAFVTGAPPEAATSRSSRVVAGGEDPYLSMRAARERAQAAAPAELSDRFMAAIDAAMSLRPADRPQSIEAFADALGWPLPSTHGPATVAAPPPLGAAAFAGAGAAPAETSQQPAPTAEQIARRRREGGLFQRHPALQYVAVLVLAVGLVGGVVAVDGVWSGGGSDPETEEMRAEALEAARARVTRAASAAAGDVRRAGRLEADAAAGFRARIDAVRADTASLTDPDEADDLIERLAEIERDIQDEELRIAAADEAERDENRRRLRARSALRGELEDAAGGLAGLPQGADVARLERELSRLRALLDRPGERFDDAETARRRAEIERFAGDVDAAAEAAMGAVRAELSEALTRARARLDAVDPTAELRDDAETLDADLDDLARDVERLDDDELAEDAPQLERDIRAAAARIDALAERAVAARRPPPPASTPGEMFRECDACPQMVVVPAGDFVFGAGGGSGTTRVEIEQFAVGLAEVTRDEFERFIQETGRSIPRDCNVQARAAPGLFWRDPGYDQTGSHPVVCVSYLDAQAYVVWINGQVEGSPYRLPSEAEQEYVIRAGSGASLYPWGARLEDACGFANVADGTALARFTDWRTVSCFDRFTHTAPVARFEPNAFGVFDTIGNVTEWGADCWNESVAGAPRDGSARPTGSCGQAVVRGASWSTVPEGLRSADRAAELQGLRFSDLGFRLARDL